jgi:hypothetical protein
MPLPTKTTPTFNEDFEYRNSSWLSQCSLFLSLRYRYALYHGQTLRPHFHR